MTDNTASDRLEQLLSQFTAEERRRAFDRLRADHRIHDLEDVFGAPAEVILEAIHRAPELTRRMLRGVLADAAFATLVVPELATQGWRDVTPDGNHAFDCLLEDNVGTVSVQVKLQRSAKGQPVVTDGRRYGLPAGRYLVETQRTRQGKRRKPAVVGADAANGPNDDDSRPYRYGAFDVLAVSLWPSSGDWRRFFYTVANWLIPGPGRSQIAT